MGAVSDSPEVIVVGAGMAGAACAVALGNAGVRVQVLERGRAPGGRMAAPLLEGRRVDIGASYFTVSDAGFDGLVRAWQLAGLARQWTRHFDVEPSSDRPADSPPAADGPVRWAAPQGLRSLVRALLVGQEVTLAHDVAPLLTSARGLQVGDTSVPFVVLAMPDPQALRLLPNTANLAELRAELDLAFDPVIAVTAGWSEREWAFENGVFVNDDDIMTFVADDGARRGDGAPVLVVHTTSGFAAAHLGDPSTAAGAVLDRLKQKFGVAAEPDWVRTHRWGLAKSAGAHETAFGWLDLGVGAGLGIAGDSWCPQGRPRVESAWLSGTALACHILQRRG
ncbi:NAD(P)-binding protein [soil metagenome]